MSWLNRWLRRTPNSDDIRQLETDIDSLEKRIEYSFNDKSLLIRALRHRSYVYRGTDNHSPDIDIQANERLEFLGDAVLGLATTFYLYKRFPDKPEGELTKRKSVLVSKSVLARRAMDIGLNEAMLISEVEEHAGGRQRRSILGDGFEALLGALFLDGGLDAAYAFLDRDLFAYADELVSDTTFINYKSLLLEHVQAQGNQPPTYLLRGQEGPDHRKVFTVEVLVEDRILGSGVGRSKKDAQQLAAKRAYETLTGKTFDNTDSDSDLHENEADEC